MVAENYRVPLCMCAIRAAFHFSLWGVCVPRGRRTNDSLWLWHPAGFGRQLLEGMVTALLPLLQMKFISSLTRCPSWAASGTPCSGSAARWSCDAVRGNVHLCTRAKLGLIFLLSREVMALCLSRIFLCFVLFSVPGDKKKKWWICSTLGVILLRENMTFKNLRTRLQTQGLLVESKTRSWGSSSFRVLPFDHIQTSGHITYACLAFYFQLLKCWPRSPTAKLWTAGPSGSSPTSCEYLLSFQCWCLWDLQLVLPLWSYLLSLGQNI